MYSWGSSILLGYMSYDIANPSPKKISLAQGETNYQEKYIINYKSADSIFRQFEATLFRSLSICSVPDRSTSSYVPHTEF